MNSPVTHGVVRMSLVLCLIPSAGCRFSSPEAAYSLVRSNGEERLVSARGDTIEVTPARLEGFLDNAFVDGDTVRLEGWAADITAGVPADSILIFVNGKFLHAGSTGAERMDLVTGFGSPGLRTAGFSFKIPLASFKRTTQPEVRGFAVTLDDRVSPLKYSPGFPWPSR